MAYRKYDPKVKQMIIASKNPNLFPYLRIPRTTALYWINKRCSGKSAHVEREASLIEKMLSQENFKLSAVNHLLMEILKSQSHENGFEFSFDMRLKHQIVKTVESLDGFINKKDFLSQLKISQSKYFRWRSEVLGCDVRKVHCHSGHPSQLNRFEQEILRKLALDPKLRNLSLKSLMYYAQREGMLSCGLDTWYKYLKVFKIDRRLINKKKKKIYSVGIRAQMPNEIWHIDVTEIRTDKNVKWYLQLVVDNFSRLIINWKLSSRRNQELTLKSLRTIDSGFKSPVYMMSDGGRENRNLDVGQYLLGKGISQLIANADVYFSNSMVEAVFRQLKQKAFNSLPRSKREIHSRIENFVNEYNNQIPHSSLGGETPYEKYLGLWDAESFKDEIKLRRINRMKQRSAEHRQCGQCFRQQERS